MDFEKLKSMKMPGLDEKTKRMIKIFGISVVVFILLLLVISIVKNANKTVSDKQLENTILRAAQKYVKDEPDLITDIYGEYEITAATLASKGYMKDITKLKGKNTSCKASVIVYHNDGNYTYSARLYNCGSEHDYTTLADKVTDEVVTEGAGLYFDEENNEYYFRGEYVNNYVKFAGIYWRIIGVNEDGNFKIVQLKTNLRSAWDNRYNTNVDREYGIAQFEGIANSRIKDALINEFNTNEIFTSEAKSVIVPTSYCVGSRVVGDYSTDKSLECSVKSELLGLGAMSVYDYIRATIDTNCNNTTPSACTNYNYLEELPTTWTLTTVSGSSYEAFYLSSGPIDSKAYSVRTVLPVTYINGNILYTSGNGSEDDPYIIGEEE